MKTTNRAKGYWKVLDFVEWENQKIQRKTHGGGNKHRVLDLNPGHSDTTASLS